MSLYNVSGWFVKWWCCCDQMLVIHVHVINFKFVSDVWQISGFLQLFRFPSPIKLTAKIYIKNHNLATISGNRNWDIWENLEEIYFKVVLVWIFSYFIYIMYAVYIGVSYLQVCLYIYIYIHPTTLLFLSQAMTWISNILCHCLLFVFSEGWMFAMLIFGEIVNHTLLHTYWLE